MKRCAICSHQARPQIDLALCHGVSRRRIAEKYAVSADSVWRHSKNHLSPEMRAALTLKLVRRQGDVRECLLQEGASVAEAISAVRAPLFGMFLQAVDVNDARAAAALAGRLHEGLALSAKLTGELVPHTNINIANVVLHPGYQALRGELLRVLGQYPDARDAVVAAFRRFGETAADEMRRSAPRIIEGSAEVTCDAA